MQGTADLIRLPPLAGVDILWALAIACALYAAGRAALRMRTLLFEPLYYRADGAHLLERAAEKRGHVTRSGRSSAQATAPAADSQERRAPHPNGWFFVDLSATFRRGQVRHLSMLGHELAVFRDDRGHVHALDAYCPHLGANMAIGGNVIGDCLECPFHGWQFKGSDGKCQHVPGAKRVPENAFTQSWRVVERNGAVFLWYHSEDHEPDWLPPEHDELTGGGLDQMCGRTEHVVYSNIQDIPENGADIGHFNVVHKVLSTLGSDMRRFDVHWMPVVWHKWKVLAPWKPLGEPDGHIAKTILCQDIVIGNRDLPFVHLEVTVMQIGPGIVNLLIHNAGLGRDLLLCQYVVPEEPLKQRVTHFMYSQCGLFNRLYGKLVLSQESYMVERDIQIWNNKCCQPKPILSSSASDESLLRFRRWFSQFYSPLSDLMHKQNSRANSQSTLDW